MIILSITVLLIFIYEIVATAFIKSRHIMVDRYYKASDYSIIRDKLYNEYHNINCEELTVSQIKNICAKTVPLKWCIQIDTPFLGNKGGTCSYLIGLIFINKKFFNRFFSIGLMHGIG